MGHDPRDIATEADASPNAQRLLAFWEGGFGTFTLPPSGKVVIGRLNECEISIDHPSVSRRHAELILGQPMQVVDLGSFNGTRVGGTRIPPNEPTVVPPRTASTAPSSSSSRVPTTAGGRSARRSSSWRAPVTAAPG